MKKTETWFDKFQMKFWEWKMRVIHPNLYKEWKHVQKIMDVSYRRWLARAEKRQALKVSWYKENENITQDGATTTVMIHDAN